MKYALISDLHSNSVDTKAVLNHIYSLHEPLMIIALGDLFECKISKKKAKKVTHLAIEEAAIISEDFINLLTFPSIIGNQELRIMQVTGLPLFQQFPETYEIDGAILIHGHQFKWIDDLTPHHKKMKQPLVFFGHSHTSSLFRKGINKPFKFNESIQLTKKRYSINVGSVVFHREWCLYDSDSRSITFMKT